MTTLRQKSATSDPRTTDALVEAARTTSDIRERWDIVAVLHARGTLTEFEAAAALTTSPSSLDRKLGADLLGQLGWSDKTHLPESVALLIDLLCDPAPEVIASATVALGHRGDPAAIPHLTGLVDHEDSDVRYGVVHGLMGHEDARAVAALIELMTDDHDAIRDWATFALGVQIDWSSPDLIEALRARLEDEDNVTRGEAMVGLARRRCEEILPALIEELQRDDVEAVFLDAAEAFADPRLLPHLEARRVEGAKGAFERALESAIEACEGGHDD